MKKLKLDFPPTGLDGKPVEGQSIGISLAQMLQRKEVDKDPLKSMEWARKLYQDGFIELDRSDCEKLYDYVKHTDMINSLGKETIMIAISDLKDKKQEKSDKK